MAARAKAQVFGRSPSETVSLKRMIVLYEHCVLSGRSLCNELIIRPEESYRLWCVFVCDQETSTMGSQRPAFGSSATVMRWGGGDPYFNWYSENTGLLGNKSENRLKISKLCDMKFAMVSPTCNFDVDKTDEDVQMLHLTLILMTWTIWRAPTNASKWRMGFNHYPANVDNMASSTNASKWRMGFNSAFKDLITLTCQIIYCLLTCTTISKFIHFAC